MQYILAIDQGTTTTTAVLLNQEGKTISSCSSLFPQHYPKEGYVEHLAHEIKNSVKTSVQETIAKSQIDAKKIAGLALTNQRETLCIFDQENNGSQPFIVWQCRRSTDLCQNLKAQGLEERIHRITGLTIDPYFTASKIMWSMENQPDLRAKLKSGELLVGTIDSFLLHWLSGKKSHLTDITNASRTMLMDLHSLKWSDECLDIFGIPKNCLPQIRPSVSDFGSTFGLDFLPDGIPILAMAGDQQAALFGQACFKKGEAKATFGTGCFILLNTGDKPVFSHHGLLSSVAYQINDELKYCLEGSAFMAGAAIDFAVETFSLVEHVSQLENLAKTVEDCHGAQFIPALCGLGAPHWQPKARGALLGLSQGVSKAHIARAVLEGVALQNTEIMEAMKKNGAEPQLLKTDGGASKNNLLLQIQADLLQKPCIKSSDEQKTALGVAYMAGIGLGFFTKESLRALALEEEVFKPKKPELWAQNKIDLYKKALEKI